MALNESNGRIIQNGIHIPWPVTSWLGNYGTGWPFQTSQHKFVAYVIRQVYRACSHQIQLHEIKFLLEAMQKEGEAMEACIQLLTKRRSVFRGAETVAQPLERRNRSVNLKHSPR